MDFNPKLPTQGKVLKKHYKAMLIKNRDLKKVFPKPPMASLRQGKNLRRLLCKARLYPKPSARPARSSRTSAGWKPCSGNRKQCPVCPLTIPATNEIVNDFNGYKHVIKEIVDCQTFHKKV